ncbi:hypothetical protein BDV29DRAFT_58436 [Aspergillus leporis]|uniref:Uncharacterized protein n=1 Tax=Aspergillus leporis TaxID=41062 RepID=A0A5N5WPU2_9EURO|nr:hypothetical protein BDV29DRAFT_58436 [Aspergillus leporis]
MSLLLACSKSPSSCPTLGQSYRTYSFAERYTFHTILLPLPATLTAAPIISIMIQTTPISVIRSTCLLNTLRQSCSDRTAFNA